MKRNEEIIILKKEHENEVNTEKQKFQGMEVTLKWLFKHNNPDLDNEALDAIMSNYVYPMRIV
ncbi:hypothetical protein TanjilG_21043 [Lupinus angustifolius]|uniref:Uncharacterized protein n=1 Tax=Lupinus angustifolius TaxID=3871 RepID=A0A394DCE5_LUPAN|nr:hypothetical protein TanjilG_21043 [Lupinus angustifolius]